MQTQKKPRTMQLMLILMAALIAAAIAVKHDQTAKAERAAETARAAKAAQIEKEKAERIAAEKAAQEAEELAEREKAEAEAAAAKLAAEERTAKATTHAQLFRLGRRWADASDLAAQTSRLALHNVFADLQAMRREAESMTGHPCGKDARDILLRAMNHEIEAYTIFMTDRASGNIYFRGPHEKAMTEWQKFLPSLTACASK